MAFHEEIASFGVVVFSPSFLFFSFSARLRMTVRKMKWEYE